MKQAAAFAILTMVWCAAAGALQAPVPAIGGAELSRRVRAAVRLDYQVQSGFTYVERRRDVRISKLGKVTIGPLRTFQVIPSPISGQTYKRLIAVDGKPLSPEELARRDAEHARDVAAAKAPRERETPAERGERQARAASEQRQRDAIMDDAFKTFDATIERRELVDGLPVLVARMTPRKDPPVTTREGRWMTHFEGYLWIAESDYQVVRIDMQATSDVTIGWGVVGRIHKGSRVLFVRRRFENAWLPAETTYEATGRTLIFRPFQFKVTTTYSDYKRRDKSVAD
jgi:hypothetical protein